MADGFKKILRCQVGGTSLVDADYANQLIDFCNAVGSMVVSPQANVGSFKQAGPTAILDLLPLDTRLRRIEQAILAGTIGGGGGSGGVTPPFWIETATNNNATDVTIRAGTVNGLSVAGVATNIAVDGEDGVWGFFLGINIAANGAPTDAFVVNVAPGDAEPTTGLDEAYTRIGNVTVANNLVALVEPMLAWSQTFVTCGREYPIEAGAYYWELA